MVPESPYKVLDFHVWLYEPWHYLVDRIYYTDMVIHCCLNKKVSCEGLLGGGGLKVF